MRGETSIMKFNVRLSKLRKAKHLTQQELADKIGVTKRTIINWEQGDREPNELKTLIALSEYFEVSIDYLLGRTEDKDNKVLQTTFLDDKGEQHTLEIEQNKEDKPLTLGQIQTVIKVLEKIGIDPNKIKLSSF